MRVGVVHAGDLGADLDVQPDLLAQLAGAGVGRGLVGLDLASRELPEPAEHGVLGAALDEVPAAGVAHEADGDGLVRNGLSLRDDRKRLGVARGSGGADARERADRAGGAARRADRRADLHHGLVEAAGVVPVEQAVREGLERAPSRGRAGVGLDGEDPGEDADHVPVQHRQRLIEGQREHGRGGIRADARESPDGLLRLGKRPAVLGDDPLRGVVQVARAAVVAQPFPVLQHLVLRGRRERLWRREGAHEALEVGDGGIDAGLLEHDLRDPHPVGIAPASGVGLAPRHRAPMILEPCRQRPVESLRMRRRHLGHEGGGQGVGAGHAYGLTSTRRTRVSGAAP